MIDTGSDPHRLPAVVHQITLIINSDNSLGIITNDSFEPLSIQGISFFID